jgi:hypothetical protein
MEWGYVTIAVVFVVGVVLAFPLAIAICIAAGGVLAGIDWFTARCPGFSHLRRRRRRRLYQPGRVVSQFLAPDVRRDVEVVDASGIDTGIISARIRTWNVLYAAKELAPEPMFGDVVTVAVDGLWAWSGERWGGPVPDANR